MTREVASMLHRTRAVGAATALTTATIALVLLVSDALEAGRRTSPPDSGLRLRWVLPLSALWALTVLWERDTRGKQLDSVAADA